MLPVEESVLRDRQPVLADDRLGADPIRVYTAPLGELGEGEAAGGAVIVASDLAEIERTAGPGADADRGVRAGGRRCSRRGWRRCSRAARCGR